jgi:hypothetical protein
MGPDKAAIKIPIKAMIIKSVFFSFAINKKSLPVFLSAALARKRIPIQNSIQTTPSALNQRPIEIKKATPISTKIFT